MNGTSLDRPAESDYLRFPRTLLSRSVPEEDICGRSRPQRGIVASLTWRIKPAQEVFAYAPGNLDGP